MDENEEVKMYQLKLGGNGLSFDRSVDEPTALAIMQIVLSGAVPASSAVRHFTLPGQAAAGRPIADARTSLRGFIDQVGAKTLPAKIVAIAAYLRDVESKGEFTQEDVGGRFKGAGEAAPANLPRDFRSAVGQGWIAEDHQHPGQYFITKEGETALSNRFEGIRGSTGRKPRRKRKASDKDSGAAEGDDE